MEQEEQTVDPQYLVGFNNGYLLAQHEPELAAKIMSHGKDHNEYLKGFSGGKQEYEKEINEWAKSFSKGSPDKGSKSAQKER